MHHGIMQQTKWILGGAAHMIMKGLHMTVYRALWQQQFSPISLWYHSDITNGRNMDLLEWVSDSGSSWKGKDSEWQTIYVSEFLGSFWGTLRRTYFDRCIRSHLNVSVPPKLYFPQNISINCHSHKIMNYGPTWVVPPTRTIPSSLHMPTSLKHGMSPSNMGCPPHTFYCSLMHYPPPNMDIFL